MSSPSNFTSPEVMSIIFRMAKPVVLLPQPDSPTRPKVSPRRTSNDTPSTAFTLPTWRRMTAPAITGKWTLRSLTSRTVSGADIGAELGMKMTGREMIGSASDQHRALAADVGSAPAARREGAARRQVGEVGWRALDRHEPRARFLVEARHRGHQADRVGMARPGVDLARRPRLDDAAAVHDADPIGVARHHAEIVGDQDQRRVG